jgi:hypothetical protein
MTAIVFAPTLLKKKDQNPFEMMQDIKKQHKVMEFIILNFEDLLDPKTELNNSISEKEIESLNNSIIQELSEVSKGEEGANEETKKEEKRSQEISLEIENSPSDNIISKEEWTMKLINNSLYLNSKYDYYYTEIQENYLAFNLLSVSNSFTVIVTWKTKIGIFVPPSSWIYIECETEAFQKSINESQCYLIGNCPSIIEGIFCLFLLDSNKKRITGFFGRSIGDYQRASLETIGEIENFFVTSLSNNFNDKKISVSICYKNKSSMKERLFEICLKEKNFKFGTEIDIVSKKIINCKEWVLRRNQQHLYLNNEYYTVLEDDWLSCTLLASDDVPVILACWESKIGLFVPPLSWYFISTDSLPFRDSIAKEKCFLFGKENSIRKGVFSLFILNTSTKKIYSFLSRSSSEVINKILNFFLIKKFLKKNE